MMAGLSDEDIEKAVTILASFKAQIGALVEEYNKSVVAANESGESPDLQTFILRQRALVQSTRQALEASLSPTSMVKLAAHVQREKRNMKVAKEDQ